MNDATAASPFPSARCAPNAPAIPETPEPAEAPARPEPGDRLASPANPRLSAGSELAPGGGREATPRPTHPEHLELLATFRDIVRRWAGGDGKSARWAVPPGLDAWFLDLLQSDQVRGLDLHHVLMGWSGYLAQRASQNRSFSNPTESFRHQLVYARNGELLRQKTSAAAPPTPTRPHPPEGTVFAYEGMHFRYSHRQLYPISLSFQEYCEQMREARGPDAPCPDWHEFLTIARDQGANPIP